MQPVAVGLTLLQCPTFVSMETTQNNQAIQGHYFLLHKSYAQRDLYEFRPQFFISEAVLTNRNSTKQLL